MVHYKLYYFPLRGGGETIRLILNYAGVKFEDIRLDRDEFTKNYKSKMPFGQMPVLEVDGKLLPQSQTIYRYLARKYGLAGKDDMEQAQVDALGDTFKDFTIDTSPYFIVLVGFANGDKDILYKEKFLPATEKYFPILKKYLRESGNGFFFKSGVTWVDFYVSELLDTYANFLSDFYAKHPELKKHSEKVHSLPQLQAYLKARPVTHF